MSRESASPDDREGLQRVLSRGWNTWDTSSILSHVRLPSGLGVRLGLKEYARGRALWDVQIGRHGDDDEAVTLEDHSLLAGYSAAVVRWSGVAVRVRTATIEDDLVVLVEPLENDVVAAVVAEISYLWNLPGTARREGDAIVARSGTGETAIFATVASRSDPYVGARGPYFVLALDGPVGFSTGRRRSLAEIQALIEERRVLLDRELDAFGADEHGRIIRDAIGWNTIFEPKGSRIVTTVSRAWNVGKRGGFGLFCWDAFFNALLAGVYSRELAYANVIEMVAEVTPEGFVPNVSQGTGRKTYDGSQPPIGSLVAWELFQRYRDRWFLREVFDGLLSWNRWWWRVRRNGPMLCLGSTVFVPELPSPQDVPRIGQHFGATCESGCDDHPVFADVPFDSETGLLRSYDVGLNAEYVVDCEALASIADELGDSRVAAELRERGAAVAGQIEEHLWDEATSTYRSHFSDTLEPTAFLSPMSFYPLIAGLGDGERSERMTAMLEDPHVFGGEWVIPSSPRTDPSTRVQSYWKGRAWPPVNFLVYLGLLRTGRTAHASWLAERSGALALKEWTEFRHVHENYSSRTGEGCDVHNSEPFYSWGALLSLMVLVDSGRTELLGEWTRRAGRATPTLHPAADG